MTLEMRQSKLFTVLIILTLLGATVIGCSASTPETNREVSESIIAQIDFSSWIEESFRVGPDSQRVAYIAQVGSKWLVVVDGVEGKQYDGIMTKTIFDSPDSFHYLAGKGNNIYLVEERIK